MLEGGLWPRVPWADASALVGDSTSCAPWRTGPGPGTSGDESMSQVAGISASLKTVILLVNQFVSPLNSLLYLRQHSTGVDRLMGEAGS